MGLELWGEFIGTLVLVLLGNGVVAGAVLNKTKNTNTGWVMIALGWGLAVTLAVYISGFMSPAHLNPAVTLAMATLGDLSWAKVLPYMLAQLLGAFVGAVLVWIHYYPHWQETKDQGAILGSFATGPAIRHTPSNVLGEMIGTAVLVMGVMSMGQQNLGDGLGPIIVGIIVTAIGFSLGGTTGYAINPARDLGPRIAHMVLPIANKGDSDWGYSWIPVIAPLLGGAIGAFGYNLLIQMIQ